MNTNRFVIRVYGLIVNSSNEVLISDEIQLGMKMTKFPGGGLEYGEGTINCLIREIKEECNNQQIENITHFYTTDFFQNALFYKNHQLISVYYLANLKEPILFPVSQKPFQFEKPENGSQSFRWCRIKDLNEDDITFPIDKFVAEKLKKHFA
jgi:ADP-ribose pyrophosphatase YjhB (NUDIX family)